MDTFAAKYLMPFLYLLEEMAPFLLLGFLIAGLLHTLVPRSFYGKWLGQDNLRSVLAAILIGIPLPLCSCGVIPTAVSMRKEGASRSAVTSFLIATPQTGVDSIAATWSVLGLPFAILRPVAALLTALGGGVAALVGLRRHPDTQLGQAAAEAREQDGGGFFRRLTRALHYAYVTMLGDIGGRLLAGLLVAGLITIVVPDEFFAAYAGHRIINMLVLLAIAVPMYVCATGSIPIAAALILKGVSPGAALVFLMAGPAVNFASVLVLGRQLGRRTTVIYVASVVIGALVMGLFTDLCLPQEWFTGRIRGAYDVCCAGGHRDLLHIASAVLLAALLVNCLVVERLRRRPSVEGRQCPCESNQSSDIMIVKVKGMKCSHCAENVRKAIAAVPGVSDVTVDHVSGEAVVGGSASREDICNAVISAGYEA